ncbi:MAG: UDP-N-acetylmuramate dehydrogenase [Bacteroidales bacterium]|jgi:UDP-N-acetylmuramate dehydrogenase|nr:UDP-N-acetylmuramate dehydrogenase [Bacteroidales bacterium]MDD4215413.1 UDP-N-acetylmuramate dehydrogenase [Bacteroidales bacterium]
MLQFQENISLKPYNTFGIDVKARNFIEIKNDNDFIELLGSDIINKMPLLLLGGGSNILFTKDFEGLVAHIANKGIIRVDENTDTITLEAAAGELWEDLMTYCVANGYYGLENLTGVPGQVGSCPIQNIGAYGTEVKDSILEVKCLDLKNKQKISLAKKDCRFGYRDSIFKHELKGKVVITSIVFTLSKKSSYNLTYSGVREEVKRISPEGITLQAVSKAIQNIRERKIPCTKKLGSAGSFFKNPVITKKLFNQLQQEHPNIVFYKTGEESYKVSAAWLIEQCGWKGYRKVETGVYEKQPLILINYGKASGKDVLELAQEIQKSILSQFNLELTPEVNIL